MKVKEILTKNLENLKYSLKAYSSLILEGDEVEGEIKLYPKDKNNNFSNSSSFRAKYVLMNNHYSFYFDYIGGFYTDTKRVANLDELQFGLDDTHNEIMKLLSENFYRIKSDIEVNTKNYFRRLSNITLIE